MFAIIAAVLFILEGLKVIESTADITWWLIGLGALAIHFVVEPFYSLSRFRR